MTITELTRMAKRIHDAEGWKLGAGSTRETRNAFWERVLGCAHWGHPTYNATPDPQWHCKDPDGPNPGSRPASDDVAVSLPSRNAWDCIPGVGADGYRFEPEHTPFFLPHEQFVFVPAKPDGAGFPEPQIPTRPPHVCPPPPPPPAYETLGGDNFFRTTVGLPLAADYAESGQKLNDGSAIWLGRTVYSLMAAHLKGGVVDSAAIVKKQRNDWRAALGLPPV